MALVLARPAAYRGSRPSNGVPTPMPSTTATDIESNLADLTGTTLDELRSRNDEMLVAGVNRLLGRLTEPDDRFGGPEK